MSEVKVLHEWRDTDQPKLKLRLRDASPLQLDGSLADDEERRWTKMNHRSAEWYGLRELARLAARVAALEAGLRDAMQYFTDANSKREAWGPMVERWRQLLEGKK